MKTLALCLLILGVICIGAGCAAFWHDLSETSTVAAPLMKDLIPAPWGALVALILSGVSSIAGAIAANSASNAHGVAQAVADHVRLLHDKIDSLSNPAVTGTSNPTITINPKI